MKAVTVTRKRCHASRPWVEQAQQGDAAAANDTTVEDRTAEVEGRLLGRSQTRFNASQHVEALPKVAPLALDKEWWQIGRFEYSFLRHAHCVEGVVHNLRVESVHEHGELHLPMGTQPLPEVREAKAEVGFRPCGGPVPDAIDYHSHHRLSAHGLNSRELLHPGLGCSHCHVHAHVVVCHSRSAYNQPRARAA